MPRRSREGQHVSCRTTAATRCLTALFLLHRGHQNSGAALLQHPRGLSRITNHHPCFNRRNLVVAPAASCAKQYSKTYYERVMVSTAKSELLHSSNIQHDPGRVDPPSQRYADDSWVKALPDSPNARQKAFITRMVQFVKAGDADGALWLYGAAGELGCRATEGVFNAVLSLCGDGTMVRNCCTTSTVDTFSGRVLLRVGHRSGKND